MRKIFELVKKNLIDHKKIFENYLFLTAIQFINSFFYLLIYPYLIKSLGIENYGLYVYATAVSSFFLFLINFGFDLPVTKQVAENTNNQIILSRILSTVFTAKSILFLIATFFLILFIIFIPIIRNNYMLFTICFISNYSFILFPIWFFQGIQDLKAIVYIQLVFKIISLPLIFIFVTKDENLLNFALIITSTNLLSALVAFWLLKYKHMISISFIPYKEWTINFKDTLPFFYSSSASYIKEYSIPIILGTYFGTREVAIYDLADKIVRVPRTLFMSINAAIFPKLITNINNVLVKKLIIAEFIISMLVVVLLILFGKFIVLLLGGEDMSDSYYMLILISFTVISWLTVGAFINFIFIPSNRYNLITNNQLIATSLFFILSLGGIHFVYNSIYMIGVAICLSALVEILYCIYITTKYNLLTRRI